MSATWNDALARLDVTWSLPLDQVVRSGVGAFTVRNDGSAFNGTGSITYPSSTQTRCNGSFGGSAPAGDFVSYAGGSNAVRSAAGDPVATVTDFPAPG